MSADDLASLPPTAPGGGEFGVALNNRTDTIDESNIGGPSRLKLKVRPPPPQYPYADTFFSFEVYVVDQHESLQRGEELPLKVTLSHYVSNAAADPEVLVMEPVAPKISNGAGKCSIKMKITDDKATMERRRFRIKVEAEGRPDIEPALTDKLTVIRNRLEILENPDNPVPDQWYKDEGGRENCVELQVHLLGPSGGEVKSRRVPLRLVLMYDNMHRVQNQEILKLSPDSKLVIDEHGKATLRVRIEEVSKNHQKQAFRIKVEPDVQEQPMSMDISSVVSKPITVLSKRINKPGKGKRPGGGGSGTKRASAADPGYVTSISRADQSSLERRVNFSELINPSNNPVDTSNVSLYEALKSVIEWTGQVVNGLQAVQWQLLGYESKADGQPDHERPLYSMSNPNPVVNSIVRRYATDTMANLHVLLKRIEAGSFDDPAPGGSAGPQGQSPGTPAPGGGMNGPLPQPPHNVGLPPGGPHNLGGPQPWGGGGGGGGGISPRSAGAGGASQGSSKRARTSSGNGNNGGGGGPDGGSSPGGAGVGNGSSGGGRSGTPSQQMDETPPSMPPSLSAGVSHMVVTRPGGGGGEGGAPRRGMVDRGPSFRFDSLPTFSEGGAGGASGAAGPPASAARLAQERSLPVGVTDPVEVDVFYILAKGYLSHELGMLGFPAYDRAQLLLGFYKEVQSQAGQTQVVFIPAHRIPNLDERDTAATTEILREEMRKRSQSIISYDHCNGSLQKMREDAFMYYWSKSMIIDMESNEAPEQQGSV
eukprot:g6970.t1